jgi:Tfp pilus assembly protein PilX
MSCLSRRPPAIPARRLRGEDGNVLVTTVMVSMVVGMLASLALITGTQADRSSSSDRNHEQALGVAEAGINQVISRISAQASGTNTSNPNFWAMPRGVTCPSPQCPTPTAATCSQGGTCAEAENNAAYWATAPQGKFWYWVTRTSTGFVVDAESTSGATQLGRGRHVQVTLEPPLRFDGGHVYALFSYTSIVIQNNDQVLDGDIFANDNIDISQSNHTGNNCLPDPTADACDPTLRGSLTAARGWVRLGGGVYVTGNAWSGGPNYAEHWAMDLAGGATVAGWARASSTDVPSPCGTVNDFDVNMASSARILGNLTTLGVKKGTGTIGSYTHQCTASFPAQPLPTFSFNRVNYGPGVYAVNTCPANRNGACEFSSVASFQSWLSQSSNSSNLKGAFLINEASPSQTNRVDLSGATLTDSLTVVTNAPIYTGTLDDASLPSTSATTLVLVSHYRPPVSTACDTEHDNSDCAVHIKNSFSLNTDLSCKTATLVYADLGPVAVKNGSSGGTGSLMCGSVLANGILVKNNETVTYDDRISRVVGFGPSTYAITNWKELPL